MLLPKFALILSLAALSGAAQEPQAAFDFTPGGPIPDEQLGQYHVRMQCAVDGKDVGTMTFQFWPEKAPVTVRNFLRYCAEGFYDGKSFHRIMRTFMIQGGDPNGDGSGDGPHGNIPGEFSDDLRWMHRYGVLSMARTNDPDSASCQFFVVCSEGIQVWSALDGKYASFGRLVHGVDTLEALASVPTTAKGGENSTPTKAVTITKATVHQGAPETTEKVERPAPDLNGEPEVVRVQHVLISFEGAGTGATRSKEDAETLAGQLLERAQAGEDFESLVREYSDDKPQDPNDPTPGVYSMVNKNAVAVDRELQVYRMIHGLQQKQKEMQGRIEAGEMTREEANQQLMAMQEEVRPKVMDVQAYPRERMAPSFGDVSFSLKPGEIGMAAYEAGKSPFGWHIIKRLD